VTSSVPTTLDDLIGFSMECSCGRTHFVDTKGIVLRRGALDDLVDWSRAIGRHQEICVVADRVTVELAGEQVRRLLEKDGNRVRMCIVPDGAGARPHADMDNLALVDASLKGADFAVAVGAGTINDLAKLASFQRGIPYIIVATAPSMNGYTSAIAAIVRAGVKRTVECRQPFAVIADLDILCNAPRHLVAAGLGDLESKPTSTADFRLSGILRGTYYCKVPEEVVFAAEARAADAAEGLAHGDYASIAALSEALLLSGISMKLAGSSSPASGGEHLISHYWDMTAKGEGRVEGWHGAQVGVATIVTSALYERLRSVDPGEIDVDGLVAARPGEAEFRDSIARRHGFHGEQVAAEFFSKHLREREYRAEIEHLKNRWEDMWEGLSDVLRPAARVRGILEVAGAPVNVRDLGLTADHLRRGYLAARDIRGRFTVLDLAADLCMLELSSEEVLASSGCM
jgi:glycerol-1-phosphate dehydrogenase [NAD(P)+]